MIYMERKKDTQKSSSPPATFFCFRRLRIIRSFRRSPVLRSPPCRGGQSREALKPILAGGIPYNGLMKLRQSIRDGLDEIASHPFAETRLRPLLAQCRMFPTFAAHNDMILAMREILESDSFCIDVGANRGMVLKHMLRFAPKGEFHAFEPLEELAEKLRKEYQFSQRVHIHSTAAGNREGETRFCALTSDASCSSICDWTGAEQEGKAEWRQVPITKLDSLFTDEPVSLVKIDVEGAELDVLLGGMKILRRNRPHIVIEHNGEIGPKVTSPTSDVYDVLSGDLNLSIVSIHNWRQRERAGLTKQDFIELVEKGVPDYLAYPRE